MATDGLIRPADALNLVTAIFNVTNTGGTVSGYAKDLLRWLSRQGVDEEAFTECARLAKGLAYPNQNGIQLQASVAAADARIPFLKDLSITLWYNGSLGRMMLKDSEYRYMVSTVASLITYHNLEFAKEALVSMILDEGGHEVECKPKYHVQRAPIKAVISRIVESIYLNVTNVGHKVSPLPEVLAALHPHLLDDTTFAGLVKSIQQCENHLLLQAEKFPADIIQWLYNHFEGRLIVYLGNEEIYAETLGTSNKAIKCMIKERCLTDTIACDRRDWPIQLLEISDFLPAKTLLMGSTDGETQVNPATRIKLYSLRIRFSKETDGDIVSVAKKMLLWLLEQKIEKGVASDIAVEPAGFVLSCPDEESVSPNRGKQLCIGDLLASTPTLLHKSTGERTGSAPIFRKPVWDADVEAASSMDTDFDFTGQQRSIEDLLSYFPAAEDLRDAMREKCSCRACKDKKDLSQCKKGCKSYDAITAVCTLLCYAIAEGFGASDAAEHLEPSIAISGVITIFGDIILEQIVRWDHWFKLVAYVIQGHDWATATDNTHEEGGTCWIGTQYGSLVVTAAWLKPAWPFDLFGCFQVAINEGNVPGIDEIASIISEQTIPAEQIQLGLDATKLSDSNFKEEFAVFRAESECFRRMSIVTASRSMRVVDIAAKMNHLSRSMRPACKHLTTVNLDEIKHQYDVKIFQLPEILKSWGRETYQTSEIHISEVLDNAHQVAVTLALAYGGAVLCNIENCCWRCAYESARRESLSYVVLYLFPTKRLR